MTSAIIILGAYLPVFPWCTSPFLAPKFFIIALGCTLGVWRRQTTGKPLRLSFMLILTSVLISALLSDSPVLSLWSRANSTSQGFPGVLLIWLCYEVAQHNDRASAYHWLNAGVAICAFIAILQGLYLISFPTYVAAYRAYGLIGSPPFFGCMMALALPVIHRGFWPLLLIAVWFSQSRAGMVGVLTGMTILFLPLRFLAPAFIVGALTVVPFAIRTQGDTMRLQLWWIAWQTFLEHPVFGCGLEGFTDALMRLRSSEWTGGAANVAECGHNIILSSLAYGGLLGLAALSFLTRNIIRLKASKPLWASTVAVLAYGMFNPVPFVAFCVLTFLWGCEE